MILLSIREWLLKIESNILNAIGGAISASFQSILIAKKVNAIIIGYFGDADPCFGDIDPPRRKWFKEQIA